MTATTTDRNTLRRAGDDFEFPVKAAAKINAGTIVVIESSTNLALKGATATGLKAFGIAQEAVDNTAGADSAIRVKVRRGVYRLANSASTDLITLGDIGADAYIVDDQTVAKTSASGTRSIAGKILDVDSVGVWIEF